MQNTTNVSDGEKDIIVKILQRGITYQKVADHLGIHRHTLKYRLASPKRNEEKLHREIAGAVLELIESK